MVDPMLKFEVTGSATARINIQLMVWYSNVVDATDDTMVDPAEAAWHAVGSPQTVTLNIERVDGTTTQYSIGR